MRSNRVSRVVVLLEMEDGEIRAIDGNGTVEIDMQRDEDYFDFEMFYNPKFIQEMRTRISVDIVGKWTMYAGRYPEKPEEAQEIESRKQLESKKEPKPGDYDFEW